MERRWSCCVIFIHYVPLFLLQACYKNDALGCFPCLLWRPSMPDVGSWPGRKGEGRMSIFTPPAAVTCNCSSSDCYCDQMKTVCSTSTRCRVLLDKRRLFMIISKAAHILFQTIKITRIYSKFSDRCILLDEFIVVLIFFSISLQRQDNFNPYGTVTLSEALLHNEISCNLTLNRRSTH